MGGAFLTNLFALSTLVASAASTLAAEPVALPPLPDPVGVAGPFAGVSHGALLVAGGANFPDKKPWEGGQKVWHDKVYVLEPGGSAWQVAGKLPRPSAYGVSVSHRGSLICVGGGNAQQAHDQALRVNWQDGKLQFETLPSLLQPLVNACGALVGDVLYVAGGQTDASAVSTLKTVYRLDLSKREPAWLPVRSWPGPGRMLATACGFDGAFWLLGGADLVASAKGPPTRRYLNDAYRYEPTQGWQKLPDMPKALVAAPSPAPSEGSSIYVLGGDDGSQLSIAPDAHRGFSRQVLRYDVPQKRWSSAGTLPAPRVTVPCVPWQGVWVVPSGEVRPGVRSPEVWTWQPNP